MKNRVSLRKNQAPPQTTHPPGRAHLADVAVVAPLAVSVILNKDNLLTARVWFIPK